MWLMKGAWEEWEERGKGSAQANWRFCVADIPRRREIEEKRRRKKRYARESLNPTFWEFDCGEEGDLGGGGGEREMKKERKRCEVEGHIRSQIKDGGFKIGE